MPDGYARLTEDGMIQWRFIDGKLIFERPGMPPFTVSVDNDMLIMTDEAGEVRSWIRHGMESEAYCDWRIIDYIDHIVVDEGFRLERNFESSTASFDLVLYRMVSFENNVNFFHHEYWEIVILQNGIFRDVIRHYPHSFGRSLVNPYSMLSIMEIDVDFDGHPDLLIWLGSFGNQGAGRYDAFLQRDGEFVHTPRFAEIMNPMINHENQSISASWRGGAAHHGREVHRFVEDDFMMVAQLETRSWARHRTYNERILVNGEWQKGYLCIINENEDIDSEYLAQCEAN